MPPSNLVHALNHTGLHALTAGDRALGPVACPPDVALGVVLTFLNLPGQGGQIALLAWVGALYQPVARPMATLDGALRPHSGFPHGQTVLSFAALREGGFGSNTVLVLGLDQGSIAKLEGTGHLSALGAFTTGTRAGRPLCHHPSCQAWLLVTFPDLRLRFGEVAAFSVVHSACNFVDNFGAGDSSLSFSSSTYGMAVLPP